MMIGNAADERQEKIAVNWSSVLMTKVLMTKILP